MIAREKPPGGGEWLNNGEIHERARWRCLEYAANQDALGHPAEADHWRELADHNRRERDRCHELGLRRQMNRRVRRGNY